MHRLWLAAVLTAMAASLAYGAGQPSGAGASSANCVIKGNINGSGEHIYHMPGQAYYDKTVISSGKGERWFCSEADARAAGWRKAKV